MPTAPAGPNPYSPLVQKGDSAYLARDFDTAIAAYREELQKNPSTAGAHFRLGQAQLAKGNSTDAEASWQTALRFTGQDETLKSKLLFALADLKEREKAYDDAIVRWKAYQEHAQAQPNAKGLHPATAAERLKRLEEWKANREASAAVKARIEKRLQEVDESLRKSSK
jgi:tetratricopeptide (TPR) repeat protein